MDFSKIFFKSSSVSCFGLTKRVLGFLFAVMVFWNPSSLADAQFADARFDDDMNLFEKLQWLPEQVQSLVQIQDEEEVLQLFSVTSDTMKGKLNIKAVINSKGELVGLKYVTEKGSTLSYPLKDISDGVELVRKEERSVLKIVGHQLSTSGGDLEMIYLTDGIFDSYKSFDIKISSPSEKTWEVLASDNEKKFTQMFLKGNWFFGKLIGIAEVNVK